MSPFERIETTDYHKIPLPELYKRLEVDPAQGFSYDELKNKLEKYGINGIRREDADWGFWRKNFKEIVISTLFGLIFASYEQEIFGLALILISWLTFYFAGKGNEYEDYAPMAVVLRKGEWTENAPGYLVPGDIVKLIPGEKIPADMRLIENDGVEMQIKNLTGELSTYPRSHKPTSDRFIKSDNIVFAGGVCVRGSGKGIVIFTGENTVHAVRLTRKRQSENRGKVKRD